jgi:membrane protease YdiL (CAAX protease family)
MFSPWTKDHVNFGSRWVFALVSFRWLLWGENFKRQFSFSVKDILIGVGSAVILYGIFYIGDILSKLMFDFAAGQVANIYQMKEGRKRTLSRVTAHSACRSCRRNFWRGYIQRSLEPKYGGWTAMIATALIYTLVHIWSFNFMLIMSALVCGIFWGLLYKYNKNLVTLIVSHALWDVSVFVLFPIL